MLLLSPGPGISDPDVEAELSKPCVHHRSETFKNIYREVVRDIKKIVHAPQGEVIILNGSGSYGMEGAMCNLLSAHDHVLSIQCGYFAQRMYQMAKQRNCIMYSLSYQTYQTYILEDVEWMMNHYPIQHLLVTHCESETGSLQDLTPLGELCHKHHVLFIVDSISGALMNEVDMELMNIDCLIMASQKGFLMPPGLSISVLSQNAVKVMKQVTVQSYIFDYKSILSKFYQDARIHSTPSVPLYSALHVALQKLTKCTNQELAAYYHQIHQYLKHGLQELHFQIMADGHESNSIIVCKVPKTKKASVLQGALEKRGIRIELGLLDKEDTILRIGIMNYVHQKDFETLLFHMREIVYET